MFGAGGIDAERHDDAVLADVEAVDQQCHEIERIERGRSPGMSCAAVFATNRRLTALLLVPRDVDLGADRFQAAAVLPRGDPEEHLLDDATIQRVGIRERLETSAGRLRAPSARTRGRRICTFRPPSTTSLVTVPARDAARSA